MRKKIIVCGASRNLGKYLAKKFEKENTVFKLGRSSQKSKNYFKCDLLNVDELYKTLNEIKLKSKIVNSVIFCIGDGKKYYKNNDELLFWKKSMETNLYTFINFINIFTKIFKKKKIKIIVLSSIAGKKIIDAPITYSVAKSALNFYVKIKALELIKQGVQINILSLGNVLQKNNNWHKKLLKNNKKIKNYIKKNVPTNKFCHPEEIYSFCNNLLKNEHSNFLGSNIVLDGGQSL